MSFYSGTLRNQGLQSLDVFYKYSDTMTKPASKPAAKRPPAKKAATRRKAAPKKAAASRQAPEQLDLVGGSGLAGIDDARLLLPKTVCALAFGISVTAFSKWKIKAVMQQGRESLYYLPDAIAHRLQRADNNENNLSAERARLARAQSEKTELEVLQLKGELIPANVILENWQPLIGAARQKVMAIKTKIKTQIPTLTDDELKKIDVICRSTLEDLANHGGIPKTTKRTTRASV